ncbi:hypothetical protein GCM10008960_28880 [Deinococcus sedimenti]|uniref:Uncharacterized protein n=2 Tax=Deinococcus sedimenti TaxID=1867090 RepID=A0ABQ2S9B3_9DEIO|nr:hypothetical protein GCM10008960_28880 [Deinococcus sedimenti]
MLKWLPVIPAVSVLTLGVASWVTQLPNLPAPPTALRAVLVVILSPVLPTIIYRFFCGALREWLVDATGVLTGLEKYSSYPTRERLLIWLSWGKWLSVIAAINSLGMILLVAFEVTEMEGTALALLWNGLADVLIASMLWIAHRCVSLPLSPGGETPAPGFTAA